MQIFNPFATRVLNPDNIDQDFPITGAADEAVIEDYDETDGKIIVRQQRYYNTLHELYLTTKWSVVNPPVITSVSTIKQRERNTVTITGSGFGSQLSDLMVMLEYFPFFGNMSVPGSCTGPNGETRFFRLLGNITYWYPTTMTVEFDLRDINDIPHPIAGPGKIVVDDIYRGVAESFSLTIIEPPQSDNWGFATQPRNP